LALKCIIGANASIFYYIVYILSISCFWR